MPVLPCNLSMVGQHTCTNTHTNTHMHAIQKEVFSSSCNNVHLLSFIPFRWMNSVLYVPILSQHPHDYTSSLVSRLLGFRHLVCPVVVNCSARRIASVFNSCMSGRAQAKEQSIKLFPETFSLVSSHSDIIFKCSFLESRSGRS